MLLLMLDTGENITQKNVCDALFLPKSSVHSILSDLISAGCLVLAEGRNRKEKRIVPTKTGEEFIRKIAAETERMESRTLESISASEMAAFLETARRLAGRMPIEAAALYQESGNHEA